MIAYYCFVNLGWAPSKYVEMPFRERSLIAEFVLRDTKQRKEQQAKMPSKGRKFRRR